MPPLAREIEGKQIAVVRRSAALPSSVAALNQKKRRIASLNHARSVPVTRCRPHICVFWQTSPLDLAIVGHPQRPEIVQKAMRTGSAENQRGVGINNSPSMIVTRFCQSNTA